MEPLPELARLRAGHHHTSETDVEGFMPVPQVQGSSLELQLAMAVGDAKQCGISFRRSPGAEEETTIQYEPRTQTVVLTTSRSSLNAEAGGGLYQAPLKLGPDELLRLTVFLDGSVVEAFASERACLTGRIYATRSDSTGVGVFARGGRAGLKSFDVFEIKPISRDRLTS
jgi:beta-fructofuranosidase